MRSLPILIIVLVFFACSDVVRFQDKELAEALEAAKQSNKKVLIDFWADG
jgi:hypothetical protein